MGWRDTVANAVTLGGQQKFLRAKADYETTHSRYLLKFQSEKAYRERLEDAVSELGKLTIASFKAFKRANRIIRRKALPMRTPIDANHAAQKTDFTRIEKLVVSYSEATSALGGAGAGSAVAVGSWSIVSLLGTASTGTAISTLSGVAATNATLAWFGGGALAAGGAGMAGGTAVLGGLAVLPVIGFMSWHSRAKAEKVETETNRLRFQLQQLEYAISEHTNRIVAANAAMSRLQSPAEALILVTAEAKRALFPVPFLSFCVRQVRAWCGGQFYREHEASSVDRLSAQVLEFEAVWNSGSRAEQQKQVAG